MPSNKAQKQNPALEPLKVIIGEWSTEGTHPYVPDKTLHGSARIEWIEGGAFLIIRAHIDDERFPDGVEIFGSDDATGEFFMLHFDERGVSRKYDVSFRGNVLTWRRDDPGFSQRMVLTIADDGKSMASKGEMNRDGKGWEPDLQLMYTRTK
ncbi:MAG: hypothetical protein KGJ13_02930 [Patescibacteria group bacterium]|nr:hypothetical protein [Patescibacteria group bacterium]